MSVAFPSASHVVAFDPVASRIGSGKSPEMVVEVAQYEWRSLSGVASSILADLDRRRLKIVSAAAPEPATKAA